MKSATHAENPFLKKLSFDKGLIKNGEKVPEDPRNGLRLSLGGGSRVMFHTKTPVGLDQVVETLLELELVEERFPELKHNPYVERVKVSENGSVILGPHKNSPPHAFFVEGERRYFIARGLGFAT